MGGLELGSGLFREGGCFLFMRLMMRYDILFVCMENGDARKMMDDR